MILGLIGLNLKANQNNIIDFDSSTKILERYSIILGQLFPNFYDDNNKDQETNSIMTCLKNMSNITAPISSRI